MNRLNLIGYIALGVALMTIVTTTIMNFMSIPFENYGNYLLWIIALSLFAAFLPHKKGGLFE
jgi:hypothetical protein